MRAYGHETDGITRIPDEGDGLDKAADRLLSGEHTLSETSQWITEEKGPTPYGSPWSPTTLRRRLRNPAIAGLRRNANGELVPGPAEELISPAKFMQLDAYFSARERSARGNQGAGGGSPAGAPQHVYYLSGGTGTCALCKNPLVSRATSNRGHGYVCETAGCGKIRISADPLDKYTAERALARLARPSSLKRLAEMRDLVAQKAKEGKRLVEELKLHQAELARVYGARGMNLAQFQAAKAAAAEQRATALADVRAGRFLDDLPELTLDSIVDWWNENAGEEQKKALLRLVVKEVEVGPATVRGSRRFDEDRFSIRYW